MYDLLSLVKRNTLIFFRDKTAVFFSLLSTIILLALYFLFIGKQYTNGLEPFGEEVMTYLGTSVMMGGVLVINTISLALGVMGNIVNDLQQRKLDAFLVTPVKRYKIILAYFITSVLVTAVLSILMWILTIIYVGIRSGYWYPWLTIFQVAGLLIFYTFLSASLMIFLTTLLKSVNAFGALSGVLGTFVGFICGIYMPLVVLGDTMIYVASIFPFTHMTILLKQVLLKDPYSLVPIEVVENLEVAFGTKEIGVFGQEVPMIWLILASLIIAFLLLFFAYRNMSKKMAI
ncbi:MAG: ABC transporter permease [Erysipelotrichaceae bacterium]|jgi:multidrug/hemolysin transport system permease protein|nr:ABC transporter permease [Erysipelotrichaceae bacterium]